MLDIRPLQHADVPGALRLSTQAGWNQLEMDWLRLLSLWPRSSLAGWDGGNLVATATLACYGDDAGWIGMILVDDSHRGHGLGGAMFRAIIELADAQGIRVLGLDATDLGRPVYLRQQFADHSSVARWSGIGCGHRSGKPRPFADSDWSAVLELDRRVIGVDRSALLRTLAAEPGAMACLIEQQGRIAAFGLSRPGREACTIGPVVAKADDMAADIVADLLSRIHGRVFVDVLADSRLAGALSSRGFTVARKLTRMSRPRISGQLLTGPMLHAGAGFELG